MLRVGRVKFAVSDRLFLAKKLSGILIGHHCRGEFYHHEETGRG
ncbi:MAG TPA: hypothetical protein ACHBX0_02350 [Arsenophonus sp.]